MIVIQHSSQVKRFENPETESYDRYELKANASASKVREHSDIVLFRNYYTAVKKKGGMKDEAGGPEAVSVFFTQANARQRRRKTVTTCQKKSRLILTVTIECDTRAYSIFNNSKGKDE